MLTVSACFLAATVIFGIRHERAIGLFRGAAYDGGCGKHRNLLSTAIPLHSRRPFVTQTSSTPDEVDEVVVADPKDRFLAPLDPLLRNERRRFIALVVIVCLIHAALLVLLILRGHAKPQPPAAEIPVEVVVIPQPQPKPEAKKKKEEPKPKPKPEKKKKFYEPTAMGAMPAANKEKIERTETDQKSASPLHGNPEPEAQRKPVPDQTKAAQKATATPAKQTAAPAPVENKPDAEPLSKAAPAKSERPTQKEKPAKTKAAEPSSERAALEREFAALSQSPHFSIASRVKPSPVSGGHCDVHASPYLCTLNSLIMRQWHVPEIPRARNAKMSAMVVMWIDPHGDLIHYALQRTSGYPEFDAAALSAVKKAAPFPPPPGGQSLALFWAPDG